MKFEDRFFPRIWDGKRYWYPCFDELGISYISRDLLLTEENIRSLDWALSWRFSDDGDRIDFVHIIEACTGLKDKNNNLIYEKDIIYDDGFDAYGEVLFDEGKFQVEIDGGIYDLYECLPVTKYGNIHQNPELLDD